MIRLMFVCSLLLFVAMPLVTQAQFRGETGYGSIDQMIDSVQMIQGQLRGCDLAPCGQLMKSADVRYMHFSRARSAMARGDRHSALRSIQAAKGLIEQDIARLSVGRLPPVLDNVLRYERDLDRQVEVFLHSGGRGGF